MTYRLSLEQHHREAVTGFYKLVQKSCSPTSKTIRPMPFPFTAISKKHFTTILEAGKEEVLELLPAVYIEKL